MAVIGVFVSYAVYTPLAHLLKRPKWGLFVSGFLAAWASIFVASLAVALQLAVSGTSPASIAIPTMAGIHALIGIGEGLITTGALVFVFAARGDLLSTGNEVRPASNRPILVAGSAISLALAVLSPLASSNPDGLEWVAEEHGFIEAARESAYSIIPHYLMPGVSDPALATIVAGILGVVIVFGVTYGVARAEKRTSVQ